MLQGNSGSAHFFPQRAKLDVVNYHPSTRPHESRDAKQVQRGSRMLMICIDEHKLKFSFPRNLINPASVFARMHADAARQTGDELWNLEADGLRWISKTMSV